MSEHEPEIRRTRGGEDKAPPAGAIKWMLLALAPTIFFTLYFLFSGKIWG